MKHLLEPSFFRTVKSEIEAKISELGLKLLEPRAKLESTNADCDTVSVYVVPKGDIECRGTCYSHDEEKELRTRLSEISLAISHVARRYDLIPSNFKNIFHSYRLVRGSIK